MNKNPPKPRRWFQFRLRTLLVGVLVLSLPLSWFAVRMERARRQRVAIAAIGRLGGRVHYETISSAPEWARDVLGVHSFLDSAIASPTAAFGDDEAKCLKDLPGLRGLQLGDVQITDAGLENFRGLTHLWKLYLNNMEITGTGLEHLQKLTNLREIDLGNTRVTDGGLVPLEGLTNLTNVLLHNTQVTDAGLVHLKGLANLKDLLLRNTQITDEGIENFQKSLPNCTIHCRTPQTP